MKTQIVRILALASISSLFGISVNARAVTVITSVPFTITKSGTYTFDKNLTLSGNSLYAITINASNVLIDLSGFTLKNGTGTNGGILTTTATTNVTIQDGTISGFTTGVGLQGSQQLVQNLRLFNNGNGVEGSSSNFSTIQDCFIVGQGSTIGNGVVLPSCFGTVVKDNQIASANVGCATVSSGGNSFIANQIANCSTGLLLGTGDKYQGNVTIGCTTPFSGGTAVGDENN